MRKYETVTGIGAPLPQINIDTDKIIPARFLKTIERAGLGRHLFNDMRFDGEGNENPDFVLNQPAWRGSSILVVGDNFGCGSSREHAPWALADYGVRAILGTDFADIFYNNSFKNGLLSIKLPAEERDKLMEDAQRGENARITVDLENQVVTRPDGEEIAFEMDPFRKHCLLNGLDDIGMTMERAESIDSFESTDRIARPWLYAD